MGTIFDRDFEGFINRAIDMAAEAGNRKRAMKAAEINAHLFGEREKMASQERIAAANRESNEKIASDNRDAGLINGLHSSFGAANSRRNDHLAFEQQKQNEINRNNAMNTLANLLTRGDNSGKEAALASRDARFDQKEERSDRKGFLKDVEDEFKNLRIQHEKDNKDKVGQDVKKFDENESRKTALDNVTKRYKEFGLTVPALPGGGVGDDDIASTISRGSGAAPGMTQQNTQQNPNDVMRQALVQGLAQQLGIQLPGQNESVRDTYNRLTAGAGLANVKSTNGYTFFTDTPTGGAYARATNGMTHAQQSVFDKSIMPGDPRLPGYMNAASAAPSSPPAQGGPRPGGNFSFIEIDGKRMSPQEAANLPFDSQPSVVSPPPPAVAGLKPQLPSSSASVTPANPSLGDIFNKPSTTMPATPGHLRQPAPEFSLPSQPAKPLPHTNRDLLPALDGSSFDILPEKDRPINNPLPAFIQAPIDAFSSPYAQNIKKDLSIIGGNIRQSTNDALGVFAESRMIRNSRGF